MTQTAFIYVQHLLGTGHAVRAAAIGKALVARGVEVTLATGNLLPPTLDTTGLEIVQLPPAKSANAAFSRIITLDGDDIDPVWKEMRTTATLKALAAKPYDPASDGDLSLRPPPVRIRAGERAGYGQGA